MNVKKVCVLFFLFCLLISASVAGRASRSVEKEVDTKTRNGEEMNVIHERLLKVNTRDYGRYDPAPALVRPPFKLIPN